MDVMTDDELDALGVRLAANLATLLRSAPGLADRASAYSPDTRQAIGKGFESSLQYLDREAWILEPAERAAAEAAIARLKG